jgi:hypothetical protein
VLFVLATVLAAAVVIPSARHAVLPWADQFLGVASLSFDVFCIGLIAGFVTLEICLRLLNDVSILTAANFLVRDVYLLDCHPLNRYDAIVGWTLRENTVDVASGITTGAYGLRMNSSERRDPPQGAVLAVGDSFTAGSLVDDQDTWPAQLERLLREPVLNAACGGWGVDQMVLRAEQLIPILKPKTVVIGILADDILRSTYEVWEGGPRPWFSLENNQIALRNVPVPRATAKSFGVGRWKTLLGHSYLIHRLMTRLAPQTWPVSEAQKNRQAHPNDMGVIISALALDRLARFVEPYGTRILVVLMWGADAILAPTQWWAGAALGSLMLQRGLGVLDLYKPLREEAAHDPSRFCDLWVMENSELGHPSKEGHALTARCIHQKFFSGGGAKNPLLDDPPARISIG